LPFRQPAASRHFVTSPVECASFDLIIEYYCRRITIKEEQAAVRSPAPRHRPPRRTLPILDVTLSIYFAKVYLLSIS